MTAYRFFNMDRAGHISGVVIIEASDDDDAVRQAEELKAKLKPLRFEVWERSRPILKFLSDPPP